MSELPSSALNKRQVWEYVSWTPEYEKVALDIVERFGEEYKVSETWEEVRDRQLLPSLRGNKLDSVRFPGPGFCLMFVPHHIVFEDRGEAGYWIVQNPRFQLTDSSVSLPNFQSKLITFQKNLRIMEELVEELDLDMVMYPPMMVIPKERFSHITSVVIPEVQVST